MAGTLTALAIKNAKCPDGRNRLEVADGAGLYLVVQASGAKSWAYRYKNAYGVQRKLTLGTVPKVSLQAARIGAREARAAIDAKRDPAAEKTAARAAKRPTNDNEVQAGVSAFLAFAKLQTRPATLKETERVLNKEVVARWHGKPLTIVTSADIRQVMRTFTSRGKAASARRSLAAMRPFFKWAVGEEIIPADPCAGVAVPSPPQDRDRTLNDLELRAVWQAADQIGYPFGAAIQLLMILGQRRDEVGELVWGELDLAAAEWMLPAPRAKNGKPHLVHLPKLALDIVCALPMKEASAYLFTTTGTTPVSGWGKAKKAIDDRVAQNGFELQPWTVHDLRRAFTSGCARIGVAPHVADAILNHKAGTIRGTARTYLRYDFAKERKEALDAWAAHVHRNVISEHVSNVVELRR